MSTPPTGTAPVWGRRAELPPPAPLPRRAEVVVVGGGVTGTALLAELHRRDVDTVLVERDVLAAGASGRNAGFLLAGVAENYARAVHRYGHEVARAVWEFTLENHAIVADVAARVDCGHRRGGSVVIALDDDEAASLDEAATLLGEDGLPGELVDPSASPGAIRALLNRADGEIDPVRLVRALAAAAPERVHERQRAVAVEDGPNSSVVHLESGAAVEAATVVLATNAWTAELLPAVPIRPVRAQMLATAPAAPSIDRPVYAEWGHRYWRQRDDGAVLLGGFRHRALEVEVGYDTAPTAAVQGHLDAELARLGVDAPVTHRWAGTMGFSADGLPLVGTPPGARSIRVCAGYTGHGMGFAVHCARTLVAHLLDGAAIPSWLDAAR